MVIIVPGPWLASNAPSMVGSKLEGFVSIADYYATFASLAGQCACGAVCACALIYYACASLGPYVPAPLVTMPAHP